VGDCRYCCDCFGECDVKGGSFRVSELYLTDDTKKDVDFEWIRSVCSLHHQGIQDGFGRDVTRLQFLGGVSEKISQ
jgi:hypothetical protein